MLKTFSTFMMHAMRQTTSKKGYTALFKASMTLFSLCFIVFYQVSTSTLPIEKAAFEQKFKFEKAERKTIQKFEDLNCSVNSENYEVCAMAKYLGETSESTLRLLVTLEKILLILGYLTLIFSIIGFIFYPFNKNSKEI